MIRGGYNDWSNNSLVHPSIPLKAQKVNSRPVAIMSHIVSSTIPGWEGRRSVNEVTACTILSILPLLYAKAVVETYLDAWGC